MVGKVIINLDDNHQVSVQSELNGQELYEAYVGLSTHIATRLNRKEDIQQMALQAAVDALKILEDMNIAN